MASFSPFRRAVSVFAALALASQAFAPTALAITVPQALDSLQSDDSSLPSGVTNPKGNIGFLLGSLFWKSTDVGYDVSKATKIKPEYLDGVGTWTQNASGAYLTDLNGKVGIGTTTPSEILELSSAATPRLQITDTTNTVMTEMLSDDTSGFIGTRSNHPLSFFANNSAARMTISTVGNVGIGTTSPGAKLEVAGQIKITGGTPGVGKALISDATGLASWSASAPLYSYTETDPTWSAASSSYYTKTNLQTSGQAAVHWGNLTNVGIASAVATGALSPTDWSTFNAKAPIASPGFTGTPTAPTAAVATNTTQIATTAYVKSQGYVTAATETDPQVGAITTNYVPKWNGTALVTGTIFDNGTGVGIGTSTPIGPLTIDGTSLGANDSPITAYTNQSKDAFSVLPWDGVTYLGFGAYYKDGAFVHDSFNTNNSLIAVSPGTWTSWYASNNSTASWNVASNVPLWNASGNWSGLIQSTRVGNSSVTGGNFGVGTTNPLSKMTVYGTSTAAPSSSDGIFKIDGTATNALVFGTLTGSPFAGYIQSGGSGTYPLSLNPNGGNVGIGTVSPGAKLEVTGGSIKTDSIYTAATTYTSGSPYQAVPGGASDSTNVLNITPGGGYGNWIKFSNNTVANNNSNPWIGAVYNSAYSEDLLLYSARKGNIAHGSNVAALNMRLAQDYVGFYTGIQSGTGQNTEKMRIDSSGNVGIGIASPGAKLEVAGQVKITGGAPGAGKVLVSDATGLASWSASAPLYSYTETDPEVGANTANYVPKWNGSALVAGGLYDNGTNIGIGTTNPTKKLYVEGSAGDATGHYGPVFLMDSDVMATGVGGGITFGGKYITANNSAAGAATIKAAKSNATSGNYDFDLLFGTRVHAGNITEKMRILAGGNVGIGTAAPGAKLEVAGQVKITGGAPGAGKVLVSDATGLASWSASAPLYSYTETDPQVGANTTNYVPKWNGTALVTGTVYDNGTNVGIGTVNPTSKLHLEGTGPVARISAINDSSQQAQLKLSWNSSDTHGLTIGYKPTSAQSYIDATYPATAGQVYGDVYFRRNVSGTMTDTLAIKGENGNIGIGTTAPGAKLEVAGQVKITGGTPGVGKVLVSDATGLASWSASAPLYSYTETDPQVGANTANYVPKWNGTALVAGTIFDNGTVGIWNTSPLGKFHAGDAVTDYSALSFANAGWVFSSVWADHNQARSNVVTLIRDGVSGIRYAGAARFDLSRWASDGVNARTQLDIALSDTDTSTLTDVLSLRSNGNVGIGTTNPTSPLHLYGNVNGSVAALIENSATVGNFVGAQISLNANGTVADIGVMGPSATILGGANALHIRNQANGPILLQTNNSERVRIDSLGNVGIGTTTPGAKLEVAGQVKITGGTPGAGKVLVSDATGLASWSASAPLYSYAETDPQVGANTTNYVPKWNGTALVAGTVFDSGTNVGIGTATPSEKLELYGVDPALKFSTAANAVKFRYITSSGNQRLSFIGGGLTELVTFDNNGNFGIGTTTPGNKLQVQGGALTIGTPGSYAFAVGNSNANDVTIGSDASSAYIQSFNSKPLHLNNQGNNTIINQSPGRVLIGTNSDNGTDKLQVTGSAIVSGNLTVQWSVITDKLVNRTVNNVSISGSLLPDSAAPATYRDIGNSTTQRWNNAYVSGQINSSLATGTSPFAVTSTTVNTNLNADMVDGLHASSFSQIGNTIESAEITDGTVTSADIANGTIASADIATDTIVAGNIAAGAVGTSEIADGTVAAADVAFNYAGSATKGGIATNANYVVSNDTRAVADTPNTFTAPGMYGDFKQNATNGLSDGGTYNGVLTFRKYGNTTDWSGGNANQLGVTDNGNLWIRTGSAAAWGSWTKFLHSGNYNTYSPTLTGGGASGTWGINITGSVTTSSPIYRSAAGAGYLNGGYAGVETTATSGAIYSIGGAYVPGTTTLWNMYGIGYGYSGNAGITATGAPASRWGMYVASAGVSRIFMDSDNGNIYINGSYNGAGTGLTGTAAGLSIGGNAATATIAANSVRAISAGSYGSTEVYGSNGAWSGIRFNTPNSVFMVRDSDSYSGIFKNNTTWAWSFDWNGVLAQGSVPWSLVSGKPSTVAGYGITDFVSGTSANPVAADATTTNGHYYTNANIALFGQADGSLYTQSYSSSWVTQIFQDYRTGQIALRGKNNGVWQAWRVGLDSSNYNTYAPTLTGGGASGSWGINITGNAATATSAVNSDTVDGYHASSFAQASSVSGSGGFLSKFNGANAYQSCTSWDGYGGCMSYVWVYTDSNAVKNSIVYDTGTNVGIGTVAPGAKLEVAGQIKITGGSPGAGKVLKSDTWGLASWGQVASADILDNSVTSADILNGSVASADIADATIVNADIAAAAAIAPSKIATDASNRFLTDAERTAWNAKLSSESDPQVGANTTNYVPKWDGAALVTGMVFDTGTGVGIGTATPSQKLDVVGNAQISGVLFGGGSQTTYGAMTIRGEKGTWWGINFADASGANIGTLMMRAGNSGFYNAADNNWRFLAYEDGNTYQPGSATASAFIYSSDRNLKKNIVGLTGSLEKIIQLNGYSFDWKKDDRKDLGVIAQEVEKIYPELVSTSPITGFKAVEYGNLVAPIIEAIKELSAKVDGLFQEYADQSAKIEEQQKRLEELEKKFQKLEKSVSKR